ncbi:MAG: polyhydroxyalkanoic acid system family protein [Bdellovibrionales bacterium]|nr:polyhydroxyalkanoic acid system family protein [Bdellovibrionales bacterium]
MPSYQRTIPIAGKSAAEIYDRISHSIEKFQEKDSGKFGKFEFKLDPAKKTVRLESSHVTADLQCRDGEVLLEGKLSFLVAAFRGKIDAGIDDWVGRAFKT